jgi:uncharacterized protein YegP (UPF0339 family)
VAGAAESATKEAAVNGAHWVKENAATAKVYDYTKV